MQETVVNIINRNYAPSPGITGESAAELAAWLIQQGINVNVVSVDAHYTGGADVKKPVGAVHRVKTFYNGKNKLLRLFGNLFEGWQLVKKSKSLRPDLTIVMTDPPLLNMWAALMLGKKHKWMLWSMDLYPEAFVAGKLVTEKSFFYKRIDSIVSRSKPDHIIALGNYQAGYITRKYKTATGATLLPCGIYNASAEFAGEKRPDWAADPEKIYLGYCGNLGEAHSADFIIEMINHLDPNRFTLILSLYGSKARQVLEYAKNKKGVTILPSVKRSELKFIDVHLASLTQEWVNVCVPSKSVSAVCSGSAFLYNGYQLSDNWALLKEAGWLIENEGMGNNVQSFYAQLNRSSVNIKKEAAARLAQSLNEMKEKAFEEIVIRIKELTRKH